MSRRLVPGWRVGDAAEVSYRVAQPTRTIMLTAIDKGGAMGSIKVCLDDAVVNRLKTRAEANGRSLEVEVRHILVEAVGEDMAARAASFRSLVRELRAGTAVSPQTPGWVLIREDRDSDRGRA